MKKFSYIIFFFLMTFYGGAQIIKSPNVERVGNDNIAILEIEKTVTTTIVHFIYHSDDVYVDGGWVNVNPDIKLKDANGYKTFNLIKAQGVPIAPKKKNMDFNGQWFSFRLIFASLPSDISKIDIIECETSNCFNFYGVSLISKDDEEESKSGIFRRDYNLFCYYDKDIDEWSDWKEGDNTFVMNYNDNGDIAHYKANGEMVLYKKISSVEEGETKEGDKYQIISALDEEGIRFKFQFFNNPEIGLKLIYQNLMIQFSRN